IVGFHLVRSVTGAVLQQRGLLPLHASALLLGAGAIALLGPSRAGKSTLAAALARRGHPVLADDVVPVSPEPTPTVMGGSSVLQVEDEYRQLLSTLASG